MKEKTIVEIVKTEEGYVIEQDGCYEKIDGCLCGNSEIVKYWKKPQGAINYCLSYADKITLPWGDVITIKRK
jgi:hypothetical protein